jgi:hypothetical protein
MRLSSMVPFVLLALAVPAAAQQAEAPQPAPAAAAPAAKGDPNAMRCRKVAETGSLVKKYKVCKTNAEWNRLNDAGNRVARSIVETGGICAGSGCGGQ